MKTHNQKIGDIMKLGFSKKTLSLMTESQVNALHKRLVNEQTAPTGGKVMTKDPVKAVAAAKAGANVELTEKKSKKGKNPWAICTSSLSDEFGTSERSEWTKGQMNKYERCVKGVKKTIEEGKNPYEFLIEQKMSEIVEKHLTPKISKKDLLEAIRVKRLNESPDPLVKPKPGVKPDTDTDFDPFDEPYPNEDPEASSPEPRTKPKPGVKPDTDTDYDPFNDPDPNDDPEAKNLEWFMSKVKRMGMLNKKRK
jgi:hypothetical protein